MEQILYDAQVQPLLTRGAYPNTASGTGYSSRALQERACRVRVPQNFLALVRRFGCRAGVRISFPKLRRRQVAYAYLKTAPGNTQQPIHFFRSFLLGVANGLIILALAGLILTFYPVLQAELAYRVKKIGHEEIPAARAYFGDLLENPPADGPQVLGITAPDPTFSIVIPKIEAKARVIANVDSNNQKIYDQALKRGVAHAAGWGFPGMGETIWLFAHSTDGPWNVVRYNAVFFLLRKLEPDDLVVVFFSGRRFNYQVFAKKIVEPHDASFLENQGGEILALQTCWPPGTTLKRLIVLAKPFDH